MKVLLMNGHGAGDSGAVGNGYKECDLTRELADLVESRLKKYATVVRYPEERNAYADVQNGTFQKYVSGGISKIDYAFEIHFNAGGGTGSEIYITSSEAGHTVEDAILKKLTSAIGVRNRGVKVTDFSVIATCKAYGVSSALLETLFIDSAADMKLWSSNKAKIADAIVAGIAEGFGLKESATGSTGSAKPSASKKTVAQLAQEVIDGKWGNGTARMNALEKAGYDYEAVQAEVNKKLGVSSSASTKKPDQVLSVGSVVTSVAMKLGSQGGVGYKKINGDGCVYVPDLGGWFPTRYLDEYDASDGKKDNYLANTNAKVVVAKTTVQAVDAKKNLVKIYGIWVDPTPLTELKDGK